MSLWVFGHHFCGYKAGARRSGTQVMQLLREEEIWRRFLALDAYCDGLLSTWQPPWVDAGRDHDLSREQLQLEDEIVVHDWVGEPVGIIRECSMSVENTHECRTKLLL